MSDPDPKNDRRRTSGAADGQNDCYHKHDSDRRPDSPSWKEAKATGDDAELLVARAFGLKGYECLKTIGRAGYDLLLLARIEVKRDRLALKTGRVAIEVQCNGEPSGLQATDADFWAFVIGSECVILPTADLRDLVQPGDFDEVSGCGDRGATTCRLVPLDVLRRAKHARTFHLPGGAP